jgi:hypothetical protein
MSRCKPAVENASPDGLLQLADDLTEMGIGMG